MTLNFTTGIPEIDRLTGGRIENGSFLLAAGNDDDGMKLFLAEVLKNQGRPAGDDGLKQSGCKILKITPENREEVLEFCRSFSGGAESKDGYLLVAESLSELYGDDKPQEAVDSKTERRKAEDESVISFVREINRFLKNETRNETGNETGNGTLKGETLKDEAENINTAQPRQCETKESVRLFIGCLHENILPKDVENRMKHISDNYFQFRMEERGMQFERTVLIYKYAGSEAGGGILKYTVDGRQFMIENKKRIY